MNGPRRYLTRMTLFLVAVVVMVGVLYRPLIDAFLANSALNGLIVGVLVLGIAYIFRQVFMLMTEQAWLESFRSNRPGFSVQQAPRLLAPMAAMLGERKERFSLSAMSLRSLLDGISSRLEESRDLSRYLIGLLIFLGLLGTFWGLLQTIRSVGDVIGGLSMGEDLNSVFGNLKAGLQAPLSGMGTAFSSSLFGLAGSLILGFLELQAGQAQNNFFNQLEEWLASQTRLSSGALSIGEGGEHAVPVYVQALLEQTADSLESLQRTLERGEESRTSANNSIANLTDRLGTLTDQMRTEQSLMIRLAETQMEMKPLLARLADGAIHNGSSMDEAVANNIRSIDYQMSRLLEQLSTGRGEIVSELRSEIRVLSRTVAAIAERVKQ
jgi:hypothetical protein